MFKLEGSSPGSPAPGRNRPGKAPVTGASDRNITGVSLLALALIAGTGNGFVGNAQAADGAPDIGPAHSGSWYNPSQNGHGFSLEFGQTVNGTPQAVVYWYVYDDRGNPLFLVGQGAPEGNRLEAEFVSPVGMAFGDFDPATVTHEPGGLGVFEFSDREHGTFDYTPSSFTADTWGHQPVHDLALSKLFDVPAPASFDTPDLSACTTPADVSVYPDYNVQPVAPDRTGMGSNATDLAGRIRLGWNLGNALEAIGGETGWGNPPVTRELLRLVKESGFDAVRIPASWDQYADPATAKIDPSWLHRVREVVRYALDGGMPVILNIHWDGGWLENNVTAAQQAGNTAKQRAYWQQIATHFRDFDERLMFASANEPNVEDAKQMAVLYAYHQAFVDAVRCTGGKNAFRVLVVQGPRTDIELTDELWTGMPFDVLPGRMMAEVHFYTPWNFAGLEEAQPWGNPFYYWGAGNHSATDPAHNPTWGEEDAVDALLGTMRRKFVDRGIPVVVGEYAATRRTHLEGDDLALHLRSRARWVEYVTRQSLVNGLLPFYWDNGGLGNFACGIFDRNTVSVFDRQILDAALRGAR